MSREHIVSECIYPDQNVMVSGFGFCDGEIKELPMSAFTKKILCRTHNSALGEAVDETAGHLFKTVREFSEQRKIQADFPRVHWLPKRYFIDSALLERWLLKVLLGLGFGSSLILGPGNHEPGVVPERLARIAFGLETFTTGEGLYIAFREKETFTLEDRVHYVAKSKENNLLMGYFILHGLRLYLNLEPTGGNVYRSIEGSQVYYRTAHFVEGLAPQHKGWASSIFGTFYNPNSYTQKLSIS